MKKPQHGFTLLELLIAMSIFSLVSIMTFNGMNNVLLNKANLEQQLDELSQLQRSMLNLARDIQQTVDRPIRDELGGTLEALRGGQNIDSTVLELSRMGWRNPARHIRSQLQRVAYSFEDNQLIRLYWHQLDHLQTSEPVRRVLLEGVDSIEIRYLGEEWVNQWPRQAVDEKDKVEPLPRAIEITLQLQRWGKITRIFRVSA